ncbi:MAG TPA: hypothetical protein VGK70_02685 [Thermoanaerobaculia bacterium]|jgi:hypothetical protein
MSDAAPPVSAPEELVAGVTNPRALGLERFPIGLRGESAIQSAWHLSVASDEGPGAITRVEISPEETFYRGEGVFLGWRQERMAAAYLALLPKPEDDRFEMHQLG